MMDRFPYDRYSPSANACEEVAEMRVNIAQFGDGYRQAAPDGINTDISIFNVAWNAIEAADTDVIYSFLKTRLNHTAFLFKMPDMVRPVPVVCESVQKVYLNRNLYNVSASLRRTAEVGTL